MGLVFVINQVGRRSGSAPNNACSNCLESQGQLLFLFDYQRRKIKRQLNNGTADHRASSHSG
jgi:hypothetical protein